jgi:hypothetical protein
MEIIVQYEYEWIKRNKIKSIKSIKGKTLTIVIKG